MGRTQNFASSATAWLRARVRPAVRAIRGLRFFLFPTRAWRLYTLNRLGRFLRVDPLMFMKRRDYLSRFFGAR